MYGTETDSSIGQLGFITVNKACRVTASNNGVTSKSCSIAPTVAVKGNWVGAPSVYTAPALVPFSERDTILIASISGVLFIV